MTRDPRYQDERYTDQNLALEADDGATTWPRRQAADKPPPQRIERLPDISTYQP